jgi:hypothetical protein
VERVEYQLGPHFFDHPETVTDPRDGFRLDVTAYAPALCLARVHLRNHSSPVILTRYLDFATE